MTCWGDILVGAFNALQPEARLHKTIAGLSLAACQSFRRPLKVRFMLAHSGLAIYDEANSNIRGFHLWCEAPMRPKLP